MKNNQLTISGAVVFKEVRGKKLFLVVKLPNEDKWEIAKVTVRRGESSIRAAIRMTSEQAGMNARVLEEAYRSTSSVFVNGKSVPQRFYYYLMRLRAISEVLGFQDFKWVEIPKAVQMVYLKREKTVFVNAKKVLKDWEKSPRAKQVQQQEEEQALLASEGQA